MHALCQAHCDWIGAAESRALSFVQYVQQLPTGFDSLAIFSEQELQVSQEQDPCISKVMPFVAVKKRPSKRERHGPDFKALRLFRQWDRLVVRDSVLYRVIKNPVSKPKIFQYVLPESLTKRALSGLHNLASHQGQDRTYWKGRYFIGPTWKGM